MTRTSGQTRASRAQTAKKRPAPNKTPTVDHDEPSSQYQPL